MPVRHLEIGTLKVIYYLSRHHDERVEHFFLLSPANLTYMTSGVTKWEKQEILARVERGDGDKMMPFAGGNDYSHRCAAGGNLRQLHRRRSRGVPAEPQRPHAHGGAPTTYYDLFRVENGFIAEHWDVMETLADKDTWQNPNGKF